MLASRMLESVPYAGSTASYQSIVLADSPLLFYPLDDVSGTTAANLGSFAGANATYTGGFTLNQSTGRTGVPKGVLLDGTSGYLSTPSIALNAGLSAFSVEYWISPTAINQSRLSDFYNRNSVEMETNGSLTGIWNGAAHLSSGAGTVTANPTASIHVVFTSDASGEHFYINGSLVTSDTSAYVNFAGTYPYYIGRYYGGSYFYPGIMAAHAFYGYALTPTQVTAHFNAGK